MYFSDNWRLWEGWNIVLYLGKYETDTEPEQSKQLMAKCWITLAYQDIIQGSLTTYKRKITLRLKNKHFQIIQTFCVDIYLWRCVRDIKTANVT